MSGQSLRSLFAQHADVRIVPPSRRQPADFAAFQPTPDPESAHDAPLVEGTEFRIYDVPSADESGFTHFLDGTERRWLAAYFGLYPMHLAHTSAGLLERTERSVKAPEECWYAGDLEAYVPDRYVDRIAGHIKCVAVKTGEGASAASVEQDTRIKIQANREAKEVALASSFQDGMGWLLVDGGIGRIRQANPGLTNLLGVVKSHSHQYFASESSIDAILSMRAGQRSSVFLRETDSKQGQEAYSCYLKLRSGSDKGPYFGLVRLEVPALESSLKRMDQLASWVMAETQPLSLPDPRYDRLLYPIHLVERHLKARQPSDARIAGLIG